MLIVDKKAMPTTPIQPGGILPIGGTPDAEVVATPMGETLTGKGSAVPAAGIELAGQDEFVATVSNTAEPSIGIADAQHDEFGNAWYDDDALRKFYQQPENPLPEHLRWQPAPSSRPLIEVTAELTTKMLTAPEFPQPLTDDSIPPFLSPVHWPRTDMARVREADRVVDAFLTAQAEAIEAAVRQMPGLERHVQAALQRRKIARPLDVDDVVRVIYERERDFCRHILRRVAEIRHDLQRAGTKDDDFTLELTTTMLYDIDETLWTRDLHFRPAIVPLLLYLKATYPDLRIGLASTRPYESILQQLEGTKERGSLTEISEFVDPESVYGVAAFSIGGWKNSEQMDSRIYGGLNPTLANLCDWSESDVQEFVGSLLPELVNLWLEDTIHGRHALKYDYCRINEKQTHAASQQNADAGLAEFQDTARNDYNQFFLKPGHFNHDLDPASGTDLVNLLISLSRKANMLDRHGRECLEELPAFLHGLMRHFSKRRHSLEQANRKNEEALLTTLAKWLNLDKISPYSHDATLDHLQVLLQRLAAAHRELERGRAVCAIAVDNEELADRLDRLLRGEILAPDGIHHIDGHALLGLENWRGRIFIISCGKRGAFSAGEIERELIALP